jgi:hypothetical protein
VLLDSSYIVGIVDFFVGYPIDNLNSDVYSSSQD